MFVRKLVLEEIDKIIYEQHNKIDYINSYEKKLRGCSPPANYTDRTTAACRRS
jgi:hypothetical protein